MKFINKYKNSSIQVKVASWYLICSILQKAVAFLVTPIFTRIMTTADFGLYSVYTSWYWIVVVFGTLNLFNGVFNNGMHDYPKDRDRYTSSIQGLSTVSTIIVFFVYLPFHGWVEERTGITLLMAILMESEMLTSPALFYWLGRQRYEYKYRAMVAVTIAISIFRPTISALFVIGSQNKGMARIVSFVLFQTAVGLIFYVHNFIKGKKFYDKTIWLSALAFNIPLIPHYLSQTLLNQTDKIMINHFCGTSYAGIYQLAYSMAMVSTFVNTSLNNAFIPWIYEKLDTKDCDAINRMGNVLVCSVATINIIIIIFAKEFIYFLGGEEYVQAIYVLPPIAWSVVLSFLYLLFGNIEFYFKKTNYTMVASSLACFVNLILNYIFIPKYGFMAAGYTTLISYGTLGGLHFYLVRKIEKKECLKNVYDYKMIAIILSCGTIVTLLLQLTYSNDVIRYISIIVIACVLISTRNKWFPLLKDVMKKK